MKPLIATVLFGILMMFSALSVKEKKSFSVFAAVLLAVLTSINIWELYELTRGFSTSGNIEYYFSDMLRVDALSLWFNTLMVLSTLLYVLIGRKHIEQVGSHVGEYYSLIFFILTGVYLLCNFNNLLILFLGIEVLSIPQYILAGSNKRNLKSSEASLKYFLMGAFSTGILLMGIALLYGSMGTFDISKMDFSGQQDTFVMALSGVLFIIVALGFKVSAAPMHFWTPDVYDGSPTVFTSLMATIVKVTLFVGFVKLFSQAFGEINDSWLLVISIITALTLLIGNLTALFQQSVKRMLAYSSIAQAGFMLFAVLAINATGMQGITLYAVAYTIATVGMFGVVMKMKDYTYDGFNGLARKEPLLAFLATLFLLSLAGIPLTGGFFAKYYVLTAAIEQGSQVYWLIVFALLMAAVSAYYYLKVVIAMYFKNGNPELTMALTSLDKLYLSIAGFIVLLIGVFPNVLFSWL